MSDAIDPTLDLVLERVVDVPPELVWLAWTTPEHLVHWFTPSPWKTTACTIDLRPGGRFSSTMQSPEGESFPNEGCYLEVVPNRRLSWTNALLPGFRPSASMTGEAGCGDLLFTAIVTMEPHGDGGTKYTAIAKHADEASTRRHAEMGFADGWGTVLTQLVAYVKALPR